MAPASKPVESKIRKKNDGSCMLKIIDFEMYFALQRHFFSRFEFLKVVRILGVFDIFEFLNMFRATTVYIFSIFLY